jgi:parallel beta helix pectate lyase-like protein
VLACSNSARLKIQGLDIRFGGAVGINAVACEDLVIEENTIYGGRDGVRLKNGDSPRAVVRRNWIVNHIDRRWWYRDMKGNVAFEGSGIAAPGDHVRIEENIVQSWFNGIGTFLATGTVDPLIRGNWIVDILDDAIEMDGVCVRGEVAENLIEDAFVGFSFAPRQVQTAGEDTWVHHNTVYATRKEHFDRNLGACSDDFVGPGCGYPSGTKFNPGAPQDLVFEHNTIIAWKHAVRGAPSGGPPPVHVRWYDNVLISEVAPTVRETGLVTGQNDYQRNVYQLKTPASNMFQLWNGTSSFSSLAKARVAAPEWEIEGREGTDVTGRGAFEPAVPLRVDSRIPLATGWVLVRGAGFVPGPGVVSSTTAFEDPPPGPPTLLSVEVK